MFRLLHAGGGGRHAESGLLAAERQIGNQHGRDLQILQGLAAVLRRGQAGTLGRHARLALRRQLQAFRQIQRHALCGRNSASVPAHGSGLCPHARPAGGQDQDGPKRQRQ